MLLMRLLLGLGLVSIIVGLGVYFITGDRRWLLFAWQLFKFGLVLGLVVAAVFMAGRFILL
ncbi:membrane protein [Novimethylophilus kurashikiensis]|uniref:Membrane protein n=1 Tax=Novimethylophilus kurashikiensis TaxID=1825523 RepID=A0A2R5FGU8_9PROT|nr:hypothetical protein [Novimethylophilus kurashikiensis]GBG15374.1 membrane protein [Novimethylophilus kurashikiensis]